MTISLEQLCQSINTSNTVLLFGSGSSIPSGAPSVDAIRTHLASGFSIDTADLSLSELAQVIEQRSTRRALVNSVRELFSNLRPTGGLLSIPRFKWKSIYTTNYDTLLEQSFALANEPVAVYSSNFDFGIREIPGALRLLKLHGSIDSDVADGGKSRLIITENDYELAEEFRQYLFTTLESDLIGTDLIIVGHSLSDPDIRTLITRVTTIRRKSGSGGSIYLFAYSPNLERAELHEARGLIVCFGGIDDFAMGLATHAPAEQTTQSESENPLGTSNHLAPITVDVHHSLTLSPEIADMFNGWPASYADIAKGSTFQRTVVKSAESRLIEGGSFGVVFLGASGVGKTTAARQLLFSLARKDFLAWEHKKDHRFLHDEWLHVASRLEQEQRDAVILIDDCDSHLFEINSLFDNLEAHRNTRLRVILTSARNRWSPRVKSPALFSNSKTYVLEKPNSQEISNLLRLIDVNPEVSGLVDSSFLGFSIGERRRRLEERCERDMFVCLKNIFASEKFDDIVLREYALLAEEYQEIYKVVAALEDSGVRVHRQLVIRLLSIDMTSIPVVLTHLADIVREYTVDERDGIYGWRGRHAVIMRIIAEYKFAQTDSFVQLYERVIDALNPTFEIEVRTLRALCSIGSGIKRISSLDIQNRLLARMISVAPGERVPRHRMIRNLIDMDKFEQAEAEIRLFSKDFQEDGPVYRYRVMLALERARRSPGLLEEDRLVILDRARELAVGGVARFSGNKSMLRTYCEVGLEIYKRTKDASVLDDSMKKMKQAEELLGDPEISNQIRYYERRVADF